MAGCCWWSRGRYIKWWMWSMHWWRRRRGLWRILKWIYDII
jgi:hypothetical protein